jgi:hypothetical protein
MDEYEATARAVREGTITLDDWARAWAPKWEQWARLFERRYRLPRWFSKADVRQELAIAAWQHLSTFDEHRGVSMTHFLKWNAIKRATKIVAKVRGVNQHTRRGPARPEMTYASLSEEMVNECERVISSDAGAEENLARAELYEQLRNRAGRRGCVLDALCQESGEVDAAGARIYADPGLRLEFRLSSKSEATGLVRDTIRELAQEATS